MNITDPPPTPVLKKVYARGEEHLFRTGKKEIFVTHEEFHTLQEECEAIAQFEGNILGHTKLDTGEIGSFIGTPVIVDQEKAEEHARLYDS